MSEAAPALRLPAAPRPTPPLRPRDAATLILVDRTGEAPRILMGRRASSHVFMAGRYVFPGGRVDPADRLLARACPLSSAVLDRLSARTGARFDGRQAAALALAAIRETFEEVGIRVCETGEAMAARHPFWLRFGEGGVRPDVSRLVPVARAITPPGPPRRFDTRFFALEGRFAPPDGHVALPTDEFDTAGWFTLPEIGALNLAGVTRLILGDVTARIDAGTLADPRVPMPFYRHRSGRLLRDLV